MILDIMIRYHDYVLDMNKQLSLFIDKYVSNKKTRKIKKNYL